MHPFWVCDCVTWRFNKSLSRASEDNATPGCHGLHCGNRARRIWTHKLLQSAGNPGHRRWLPLLVGLKSLDLGGIYGTKLTIQGWWWTHVSVDVQYVRSENRVPGAEFCEGWPVPSCLQHQTEFLRAPAGKSSLWATIQPPYGWV